MLRRYIRVLTEGAPYPRGVRLLDVVEEEIEEQLFRTERFPLNNRNSRTPLRLEREFSQEIIRTLDIGASFGVGVDYYVTVNLEARLGLKTEKRVRESVKVAMETEPGEQKEYVIIWREVVSCITQIIRQSTPGRSNNTGSECRCFQRNQSWEFIPTW